MNRGRTILLLLFLCTVAIASCRKGAKDLLPGRWQEISIQNPQLEETIDKERRFIDTVGSSTDSIQNIALYGTNNIDTMRKHRRIDLDSFTKAQARAVAATWFEFRKGGQVVTHSDNGLDSASWFIDDDGGLIIDDSKDHGTGHKLRFEIPLINDTILHLRFNENYLSSTAIFRRVKN